MARLISKETMTVGIVAVLAGLVAAYGIRSYLTEEEVPPPPVKKPAPKLIGLPIASTNLPADRVVARGDIVLLRLTREKIRERFKDLPLEQLLVSVRHIVGRRLLKPIPQGQPFITTGFYLQGTSPSIAKKLQPGFRAIRVEVSDTHEAGVQPGMFVDVMFRAKARAPRRDQPAIPEKTLMLLRHIEVLEAEQPGAHQARKGLNITPTKKATLVTLAVPEEKADYFGIIEGRGEVWLVPTPTVGADVAGGAGGEVADAETLAELLGIKPKKRPAPAFETAIYQRGKLHVNHFVGGKMVAARGVERAQRELEGDDEAGNRKCPHCGKKPTPATKAPLEPTPEKATPAAPEEE